MSGGKRVKGTVRQGQLITTYGVGAVVAVEDESFMIAGTDAWGGIKSNIHEPRLERLLNVNGFALPPAGEFEGVGVPVVRFPNWYFCPECERLDRFRFFSKLGENKCGRCGVTLVPSRFVMACEKGHIDDFPYFEWVHKGAEPRVRAEQEAEAEVPREKRKHQLKITAGGVSAALRDIVISCSCGVPPTTMHGAFSKGALSKVKSCTGRQPWLGDYELGCMAQPRTLQRGASNVYFAVLRSALSIPPWSEGAMKIINEEWSVLQAIPVDALKPTIENLGLAEGTPYSPDDLVAAIKLRKTGEAQEPSPKDEAAIRRQEYEALVNGKGEVSVEQDFVCEEAEGAEEVEEWFEQVMAVKRLREVRVLTSFTRLEPPTPGDPDKREAPLSKTPLKWLPAIEVMGEGVFFRLRSDRLRNWEQRPDVIERAARIDKNYQRLFQAFGRQAERKISPRLILVHGIAHMLIQQWSLASGYPAASLRERLYVGEEMAGLMIFTATNDSAGSLGGVIAQVEAGRLPAALEEALERTSWCSADPLCIEADAQGAGSLNLAACHACILLPEVSCEEGNGLLDRGLIVGTAENPELGFFADALQRD